jgi:hypothetical protein
MKDTPLHASAPSRVTAFAYKTTCHHMSNAQYSHPHSNPEMRIESPYSTADMNHLADFGLLVGASQTQASRCYANLHDGAA